MPEIQPDQARFLLNTVFLPGLKNEHRITTSLIEAIPADKGDFRPDHICKSALDLAKHIAISEAAFLNGVVTGEFNFGAFAPSDSVKNSQDLAKWHDEIFSGLMEKLTNLPDADLAKVIDFMGVFQMPAVMYLNFLLQHSAHHRGQLSMYLRPMGAKVPSIYGESFDAAEARKAAASHG